MTGTDQPGVVTAPVPRLVVRRERLDEPVTFPAPPADAAAELRRLLPPAPREQVAS